MSSVAVPKKMVPVPNIYGVEAFKEIKPEIVALHPVQHKDTLFTTTAQNRISFRVPAYSNALLDTSRSFLYMKIATVNTDGAYLAPGMPILSRMVVKTSAGLTLEDISDMDVLSTMLDSLRPAETRDQSVLGNAISGPADIDFQDRAGYVPYHGVTPFAESDSYKEAMLKFNFGIFSKHLTKFLPLFMADGGAGYSFDVDLYLSDNGLSWDLDANNETTSNEANPLLAIHSPVWYMHLMRMDEGLARRFNQMAVHGEEIRIPFTTWHTHRSTLVSNSIIAYIHENATNFKKILTCVRKPDKRLVQHQRYRVITGDDGGDPPIMSYDYKTRVLMHGFEGGRESEKNKVNSYNYRIGVQHVYNEPVQETNSNARTLMFVRSAFGVPDDVTLTTESRTQPTNPDLLEIRPFDAFRWCSVASFDYSPGEQGVIQGISSSNPVELSLTVDKDTFVNGSLVMNYCELAYDLVFKGGAIHYEEQKPGSQSVY